MRAVLLTLNATVLYVLAAHLLNLFSVREIGNELLLLAVVANVVISLLFVEWRLKKYGVVQAAITAVGALLTFPFLICLAIPGIIELVRRE